MVAYVLVCQLASVPATQRHLLKNILLTAVYGIWISSDHYTDHFCIHPKMSTLHVLTLDYLVRVYPLFLIFLTYITVTFHDRYPLVVKICSLVQAFTTFLVLSYVKILFDPLTPVYVDGSTLNQTSMLVT